MRLAVYTDSSTDRSATTIQADRAFALFVAELAPKTERLRLIGRLAPGGTVRAGMGCRPASNSLRCRTTAAWLTRARR